MSFAKQILVFEFKGQTKWIYTTQPEWPAVATERSSVTQRGTST